jgi:hypothetical protein
MSIKNVSLGTKRSQRCTHNWISHFWGMILCTSIPLNVAESSDVYSSHQAINLSLLSHKTSKWDRYRKTLQECLCLSHHVFHKIPDNILSLVISSIYCYPKNISTSVPMVMLHMFMHSDFPIVVSNSLWKCNFVCYSLKQWLTDNPTFHCGHWSHYILSLF